MDDINYFSFSFSSKSTLFASLNCICNYKPLCNHLCDKLFLPSATKDSMWLIITKVVDLDISHKCMDWNGHDSF